MSTLAESPSKTSRSGCWILHTAGTAVQRWQSSRHVCWMLLAVSVAFGGCRATHKADQVSFDNSGSVLRDPLPVEYSPGPRGVDPQHAGYCRPQWRVLASRPADCCTEGCEECVGPGGNLETEANFENGLTLENGLILEAEPALESGEVEKPQGHEEAVPDRLEIPDIESVPPPPPGEEPNSSLDTDLSRPAAPGHPVGSNERLDTSLLLGLPQVD